MKTKICSRCNIEKTIDQFYKRKGSKDGFRSECKECFSFKNKQYHCKNREQINNRNKKYNDEHKQEIQLYQENYQKEYYKRNREQINERNKLYNIKNKEKVKKYKRIYNKERKNVDILFKFISGIRRTISTAFKKRGYTKSSHTYEIVGLPYNELKNYLFKKAKLRYPDFQEREFLEKNKYHIDHIIPLSLAKTKEDVLKLNHYTNFQLLLAEENLQKSASLNWEGN